MYVRIDVHLARTFVLRNRSQRPWTHNLPASFHSFLPPLLAPSHPWRRNAPNGPGNDFGTCAFATALRQSRAYQNACIYANTIMAHPEIDPSIMAVAVENGTTPGAIDMAASVQQCLANGCTIHPWSAAFLSASYVSMSQAMRHMSCMN